MRHLSKRIVSSALVCVLMLSGCGKEGITSSGNTGGGTSNRKTQAGGSPLTEPGELNVWRESNTQVGGTLSDIGLEGLFCSGDTAYFWGIERGDDYNNQTLRVAGFDMKTLSDLNGAESKLVPDNEISYEVKNGGVDAVCADADGNIYVWLRKWEQAQTEDDGETIPEDDTLPEDGTEVDDSGDAEENAAAPDDTEDSGNVTSVHEYATEVAEETVMEETDMGYDLVALSAGGEVIFTQSIEQPEDIPYWGGTSMVCADGMVVVSSSLGVVSFDAKDGTQKAVIQELDDSSFGGPSVLYTLRDGTVVMYGYGEEGPVVTQLDVKSGKTGKECKLPDTVGYANFFSGAVYDFCFSETDGIKAFNLDEEEVKELVSFSDSDLLINSVNGILPLSDDAVFVMYFEDATQYIGSHSSFGGGGSDNIVLSLLTRVAPEDVPERTEITLATTYLTTSLSMRVAQFNRTNNQYRIRIINYSNPTGGVHSGDDWYSAMDALDSDLISGNIPDMVALDDSMSRESYFSKGVFEPLDGYIENDPDLAGALMENIQDAYRYQGKTYVIVPSFMAIMVVAKKSMTGDTDTWTPADVERIIKENGIEWEKLFGENVPRESLLLAIFQIGAEWFMDREQKTCEFDSPRFIDLLEFTMHFPSQREYEQMDQEYNWQEVEARWRANEALLKIMSIADFNEYRQDRYGTFGEEIEVTGFPLGEKGAGCTIIAEEQIAMSAHSEHKEACWDFMRTYLLPDYQENVPYGFPVTEEALRKMAQEARKPDTYTDENGKEQVYERITTIGDAEIKLPVLSEEDTDFVIEMLHSLDKGMTSDKTVISIIEEETEAFYSGNKTAEEVAKIIQNRVQLYLNEQ